MAQKAEEYGSHPTTFEMANAGVIKIILESGEILHEHLVNEGDIWRCSTSKKAPIFDWIKLGIERQKITGSLAIFWLDKNRAHDNELIRYVDNFMNLNNFSENFKILSPRDATRLTLETIRKGEDVIAITGNVLRDYLTDLFPILELGTSAKMLSIVKLMNGGGLFETGAGGSAPKHVQQLVKENHLRWDSLGEFCALAESFRFLSKSTGNKRALCLSEAIEIATQKILDLNRSPKRKVGQQDNRTSHFYFALYWSEAIADQASDVDLASSFKHVSKALKDNESLILEEFKIEFYKNNFQKYYLYKPGIVENYKNIMSIEILNKMLSIKNIWNNKNFIMMLDRKRINYSEFSKPNLDTTGNNLRPDPKNVQKLISKGASIILNDIEIHSPELSDLANIFQLNTHGRCQGNLYFSMESHQAFGPHCDQHDVFAIHFEGEKTWNIYEKIYLNAR